MDHEVLALRDLGGLPNPDLAHQIWKRIWYHETHNSTALEGNTLVLKHVEALLARGETAGKKDLTEYLEVRGYADAARWVYEQAREPRDDASPFLTLQEVRHVHNLAMSPVWEVAPHPDALPSESPGNFREHDLHPFDRGMLPPTHPMVHASMAQWVADAGSIPNGTDPICVRVAQLHAAFERVHPFLDGNGRTGRLLTNLMLVRLGYPPAIIQKRERNAYLKALDRADRGDNDPLGELLARAVLDSLLRFLYPAVATTLKLVPLEALADHGTSVPVDQRLSHAALRQAAERGRLTAQKDEQGHWRSSKKWVAEYRKTRYAALRAPRTKTAD